MVVPYPFPFIPVFPMPLTPSNENKGGILNGGMVGDDRIKLGQSTTFPQIRFPKLGEILVYPIIKMQLTLLIKNNAKAPGVDAIPEEDKDEIAEHAADGGHGYEMQLDDPTEVGIKEKINDILKNPSTRVKIRKHDGAKLYMTPDGFALIHNPKAIDNKGTIYQPDDPQKTWDEWK